MSKTAVAILISGRGSNMVSLLDAMARPGFPAEPVLVLSDKPEAPGLTLAAKRGVATAVVERKAHGDKAAFEQVIQARLAEAGAEIVCLAGFMRVLSPSFVNAWAGRMLNIHPSLLPSFTGLDTHARALAAGVKLHGCTVHLVTAKVDGGPILGQAAVPVLPDDDEASLAARVLAAEHRLYPACLRALIEQRAASGPAAAHLFNPPL